MSASFVHLEMKSVHSICIINSTSINDKPAKSHWQNIRFFLIALRLCSAYTGSFVTAGTSLPLFGFPVCFRKRVWGHSSAFKFSQALLRSWYDCVISGPYPLIVPFYFGGYFLCLFKKYQDLLLIPSFTCMFYIYYAWCYYTDHTAWPALVPSFMRKYQSCLVFIPLPHMKKKIKGRTFLGCVTRNIRIG